jgi:type II secretory pathway pseudopilin PulG
MQTTNENGFSLLELAVSAAILITITTIAAVSYTQAADNIKQNIQEVKNMQAANPDTQYLITFE